MFATSAPQESDYGPKGILLLWYAYKNIKYNVASKTVIVYLQVRDYIKLNNIQHIENYHVLLDIL